MKKEFSLIVAGEALPYEIEKKSVKRITLRVRRDGSVHVTIPSRASYAEGERVAKEHADWIAKKRAVVLSAAESRQTVLEKREIPLRGVPHALLLQRGARPRVTCTDGALTVTLRDPESEAELVAALRRFIKAEATRVLTARLREIYADFSPRPATFPKLSFRWMRSRWGSCTASKNHVTLNEKLLLVHPALADYVLYHELCHFKHQNHSPDFWAHLSRYVPNYKELRKALNAVPLPELEMK